MIVVIVKVRTRWLKKSQTRRWLSSPGGSGPPHQHEENEEFVSSEGLRRRKEGKGGEAYINRKPLQR